jgi:hypothetical protein
MRRAGPPRPARIARFSRRVRITCRSRSTTFAIALAGLAIVAMPTTGSERHQAPSATAATMIPAAWQRLGSGQPHASPLPSAGHGTRHATDPPVVTRADFIAAQLARDPVFITDDAPRDITPVQADRIRAALRRMPVPTYAAVVADADQGKDPQGGPEQLIALLHDKLGRSGVYLVVPSSGIGVTAQQFGENLPLEPAAREVTYSQPYNAGAARVIERFVDDIRSGQAQQRYDKVYAKSRTGWEAKPYREADDDTDLAQEAGVYSGMGAALLLGAGLGTSRVRRRRKRGRP